MQNSMMITVNPYQQYKKQGVMTASPADLVVMLYDGLLKQIQLAQMGIRENDIQRANSAFQRAQDILGELSMSLDMTYPIARELLDLYEFALHELVKANMSKSEESLPDLTAMFGELREAWVTVARDQSNHATIALKD